MKPRRIVERHGWMGWLEQVITCQPVLMRNRPVGRARVVSTRLGLLWVVLNRKNLMMNIRKITGPVLLATMLLMGSLALAADTKKPSGTVAIDETQFAFILGGSVGGGKLMFEGQEYPFKIGGLTVGVNGVYRR